MLTGVGEAAMVAEAAIELAHAAQEAVDFAEKSEMRARAVDALWHDLETHGGSVDVDRQPSPRPGPTPNSEPIDFRPGGVQRVRLP